jgi:type II secretory pathway pseudopilin PulG
MRLAMCTNIVPEQGIMHMKHRASISSRVGLTLIELLVTISVMATVAGMFVIAYRGAATEANNIKTAATIRKINDVLTSRLQEYEQVRVEPKALIGFQTTSIPTDARAIVLPAPPNPNQEATTILFERLRLFGLRQIIVQEMPDHPDDLKWTTSWYTGGPTEMHLQGWLRDAHRVPSGLFSPNKAFWQPSYVVTETTMRTQQLIRRLSVIDPGTGGIMPIPGWELTNANAELLYLIVEDSNYNGSSAIELFGRSEIRDTDNDGLNEFIDTYGNPIRWIRWPAGTEMSIRSHPDLMDPLLQGSDVQGDPADRLKADPEYASYSPRYYVPPPPQRRNIMGLRPLIVSPGADRRFGLRMQLDTPVEIVNPRTNDAKKSFSIGDIPLGNLSTQISTTTRLPDLNLDQEEPIYPGNDLPYFLSTIDCYVADPWYPRSFINQGVGFSNPKTRSRASQFFPDPNDQYYHVAEDQNDNISNADTGGGAL